MSYKVPKFIHPELPENKLGYTKKYYEGGLSSLCAGCGHDSISASIALACYEMSIEPHKIAKLSGIGCSSKTPAYYLNNSHGFNSVHGRMPSVATGANMANGDMVYIGVSGDGDSASIGMGQFVHVIRRNINMVYVLMNNGCYGLTKGQDSATADKGSRSKKGAPSPFSSIDMASLALELGGTFVAQSFSGDKSQLVPLIKAAINHNGFAFINVISPCVTFNNNSGSTKSYDYFREHAEATSSLDFVAEKEQIVADYKEGSQKTITLHDGSKIYLDKLAKDWDPTDFDSARASFMNAKKSGNIPTGLIYLDQDSVDLHEILNSSSVPLNQLDKNTLCPGSATLEKINSSLR